LRRSITSLFSGPPAEASTLLEILQWRAFHQRNKPAYTFLLDGEAEELHLTYGELDRQARAIACCLQLWGLTGQRALLFYPSGLDYIAAFFACLYAGVVAVPAYPPRLNRNLLRLQAIVTDSGTTVGLSTRATISRMKSRLAQTPNLNSLQWLETDSVDQSLAAKWSEPSITGDTLAFLQYTSGSTAEPKGVMVSHRNLLHNEQMIQRAFEHTEESTFVSWLPLYHDMGLIGNVLQPLYVGARCILMAPEAFLLRPSRWVEAISRYRGRTSGGPNFAYDLCVRKIRPEQLAGLDLTNWTRAFNGSEPVRLDTIERFASAFAPYGFRREAFYPCYGLAEATLFVSGGPRSRPVHRKVESTALRQNRVAPCVDGESGHVLVACGEWPPNLQIAIVNPASLTRCLPHEVGEIWVSGSSVAAGYWSRPQETENTFRAYLADSGEGPFLRTGDLGFFLEGQLFVAGRLKDVIIVAGSNHYPQDIEATVEQAHPTLRAGCCAAFSVDVEGQERLIVMAEVEHRRGRLEPSSCLDAKELVRAIRQSVAEHHGLHVDRIFFLKPGSIPKTSSGKIRRNACRSSFLQMDSQASSTTDLIQTFQT
jgi:acyl-CoA synthetase (AMP-forming)/AMP-acid ligase II